MNDGCLFKCKVLRKKLIRSGCVRLPHGAYDPETDEGRVGIPPQASGNLRVAGVPFTIGCHARRTAQSRRIIAVAASSEGDRIFRDGLEQWVVGLRSDL